MNGGPTTSPVRGRALFATPPALTTLGVCLALYLGLGKGFSHFGVPPVFIGEVLLLTMVAASLRPTMRIPTTLPAVLIYACLLLGVAQLSVDVTRQDGAPVLESLRGFAVLYYALFSLVTYALLRRHEATVGVGTVLDLVDRWLRRSAAVVVPVLAVLALRYLFDLPAAILHFFAEERALPTWPSGALVIQTKPADIAVALVVFMPVVFKDFRRTDRSNYRLVLLTLWVLAALLVTARSRGALLAFAAGGLVVFQHQLRTVARIAMGTGLIVLILFVSGARVQVGPRELSFDGLVSSVASLTEESDGSDSTNAVETAQWRSAWWSDIWADVEDNRMVLHGRGWGDNLALRFGVVQAEDADDPLVLRLPHNIFFSLAGRAGLLTAVTFIAVIIISIASTRRSQLGHAADRPSVRAARGALAAALAAGLTDVYLESPQGAIVLWTACGFLWWATASARGGPTERSIVPAARRRPRHRVPFLTATSDRSPEHLGVSPDDDDLILEGIDLLWETAPATGEHGSPHDEDLEDDGWAGLW